MSERVPEIRTTEVALFKRCQWAWWHAYREGLKPRGREQDALAFGTWIHLALAAWYVGPGTKRGPHPAETFASVADDDMRMIKTNEPTEDEVAKYTDLRDMGIVLMEEYVKTYGQDEHMLIIQPEKTYGFDIPFPDWWGETTRKMLVRLVGTVDGVYRDADTGWLWILEHKTAKTIRTGHLALDEQAGRYWAFAPASLRREGLIKPTDKLKGIMYNFIRKGLPDPRPRDAEGYCLNKDGSRSKIQPPPLFQRHPVRRTSKERAALMLRTQADAAVMEMYRTGELPLSKTPHWSCERFCDFFEMCRLHEAGGNWKEYKKVMFRQQDPYADHRKSAEETSTFEF